MNNTVQKILRGELGADSELKSLDKLHGDASYRTYYRAILSDGRTFIVMQMPKGRASASEEITNFKGNQTELPFMNVAKYLRVRGISVPDVYVHSEKDNILILEDLGDDLMAKKVADADMKTRMGWYEKAIDLLTELQKKTKNDKPENCVALCRSFDDDLLNWEFDHFLEYGIEARLGIKMEKGDLEIFRNETRAMAKKIRSLPYGFTHRDFQSRNLIVRDGKLFLIDFQDALLGPAVYDLVALLRDSYVKLSAAELDGLVAYYAKLAGKKEDDVRAEFDLVTIQRKLKDAGRFVYIERVKGNPSFLKFISASLGYVKKAFERLPQTGRLYDMLRKYIPEWNI